MSDVTKLLDALASITLYPNKDHRRDLNSCLELFTEEHAQARSLLVDYSCQIEPLSLYELEELYIRTFDLNRDGTLDLGWHLFGEDYNRGLFLAKLRQYLRSLDIRESEELPDHASHVLKVIGRMSREEANQFVYACVIPALQILGSQLAEQNPYHRLVHCLVELLSDLFDVPAGFEDAVDEERQQRFSSLPIIQ